MIDLPPPVAAVEVVAVPRFAPPLGRDFRFRTVRTRPGRMVTSDMLFRLDAGRDGTRVATFVATGHRVDAPAKAAAAIGALLTPFEGRAVRIALDAQDQLGSVEDGAGTWAAVLAAHRATVALLDGAARAALRAVTDRYAVFGPAERDATLRDAYSGLLPPPLPALRVGEERRFASMVATPVGLVAATGRVRLAAASVARLDYVIERDSGAIVAAAGRPLAGTRFVERTELAIERATGLPLASTTVRTAIAAAGARTELDRKTLERLKVS